MATQPNFTGRWKADLSASRLQGPMPKEIVVSIAHAEPDLKVEMTMVTEKHSPTRMAFATRTTNEPTTNTVRGGEWISRARWIGDELLIESHVSRDGWRLHFLDYWSLSNDGRRLTMEHRDDALAGQVTILDRTDAAE